jgi:hypothetical protein
MSVSGLCPAVGIINLIFVGKNSEEFQAACEVANRCAHALGA